MRNQIVIASGPNDQVFILDAAEGKIHFIGVSTIEIDATALAKGDELIIEDAPMLEKVQLKNKGVSIIFATIPNKTVKVHGPIEDIKVIKGRTTHTIARVQQHSTLPFEPLWGAIISKDIVEAGEFDALILVPNDQEELVVSGEWSQVSVIEAKKLTSLKIEGERIMRVVTIANCPQLSKLDIRRRVLTCAIIECPSITSIRGFGDRLQISPRPENKNFVSIGGFWHDVPSWYDEQVAMLRIAHFDADPTIGDLVDCGDLGGITFSPSSYDGPGGLCHWSAVFDIAVDELSLGISIPILIEYILSNPVEGLDALMKWADENQSRFDQYKAMRVLVSLICRGVDENMIHEARNKISALNHESPMLSVESVNNLTTAQLGGRWRNLVTTGSDSWMFNDWHSPLNSVMPFGRLDLEIWLHSDLDLKYIGIDEETGNLANRMTLRKPIGKNPRVRSMLVATLSASGQIRTDQHSSQRLNELVNSVYTDPRITADPFCCEFIILHLKASKMATKSVVRKLVDGILRMKSPTWAKVALLVGITEQINPPSARMALRRLASDKELSLKEAKVINEIAIAGKRAFKSGAVNRPEWPYLKNWGREYGY
ncbi:MAG TPA: hypothetical protein EYG33_04060 [Candidatus Poseidoniales archaeon]|nr:hypothetical protein [Candidatus Poseidoniales archaeon]